MLQHGRGDLSHNEITHPITARPQRDPVRAVRERPHLGDDDPRAGAPAVSEVDDEEPDHGHGSPAARFVRAPGVLVGAKDAGDDEVASGHARGSGQHDGFAAELVDVEDGGNGGDEHGDADYACCE